MIYRPDFFLLWGLVCFGLLTTCMLAYLFCLGFPGEPGTRKMKIASLVMGVAAALLSAPMVSVGVVSMFTTGALDSHSLKKSERVLVTITHVNPPKHFYISFMDDALGLQSDHVYVSKHFNGWNRLGVGETIAVTRNSVVNRRGWLVEKLSMHKWPLFGRCFFSDSEIGRTEYKYTDVRKGVEEVLR